MALAAKLCRFWKHKRAAIEQSGQPEAEKGGRSSLEWLGICSASCILSLLNDNLVMFAVRHYLTEDERDPYQGWLKKLRDTIAKMQVVKRVNRIEGGNFGDHKFCREGVWELRIDQGAGYRV